MSLLIALMSIVARGAQSRPRTTMLGVRGRPDWQQTDIINNTGSRRVGCPQPTSKACVSSFRDDQTADPDLQGGFLYAGGPSVRDVSRER